MKRTRMACFLVALSLMYIASPLIEHVQNGTLIESVLMTLVLLSAILAVGERRTILILSIVLVLPALVGKWANHWRPDLVSPKLFLGAGVLFIGFIVLRLLRFILHAPRVDSEILCAGIATYLMFALLWAFAYELTALWIPDSFVFTVGSAASHSMKGFNSLYFSFVTLSTGSYGTILPLSNVVRVLAMTEQTVGMFYITVLIARLVGLYSSEGPEKETQ